MKTIDVQQIAQAIRENCPEVAFAYLFGSSQEGTVNDRSDIDIAVYYTGKDVFARFRIEEQLEKVIGREIPIDIVELQKTRNFVLAFEALRGKMLFVRDEFLDDYVNFYVYVCREYEDDIYWMKKQLEYRGYEVQWDN
ncbi:MAG: nucleotidyltransferase domain-containing protein [Dysgonamonadaceae bacterium]|jgi:predicted nucleotidyltransferase|nr:nucleotidyltransferase domain-containing protein [Dysgonamonadaceae bacterium]